jgi:hypothetical protein
MELLHCLIRSLLLDRISPAVLFRAFELFLVHWVKNFRIFFELEDHVAVVDRRLAARIQRGPETTPPTPWGEVNVAVAAMFGSFGGVHHVLRLHGHHFSLVLPGVTRLGT